MCPVSTLALGNTWQAEVWSLSEVDHCRAHMRGMKCTSDVTGIVESQSRRQTQPILHACFQMFWLLMSKHIYSVIPEGSQLKRHLKLPFLVWNTLTGRCGFFGTIFSLWLMFSLAQKWLWELVQGDQVTSRVTGLSRWGHFSRKCHHHANPIRVQLTHWLAKGLVLQILSWVFLSWALSRGVMLPYRVAWKMTENFQHDIYSSYIAYTHCLENSGRSGNQSRLPWHAAPQSEFWCAYALAQGICSSYFPLLCLRVPTATYTWTSAQKYSLMNRTGGLGPKTALWGF